MLIFFSGRLRYFDIDLFNEDPTSSAYVVSTPCYFYDGMFPEGATETLLCQSGTVSGRYLRITNTEGQYLTLCEVEVYQ